MAPSPCPHFTGKRVLVLGGGAFGSSAALSLARHAYPPKSIIVVDRSAKAGPAADAASSDINKIVRSSYWDSPMYSALGAAALERWRGPLYKPSYHESGLLLTETDGGPKPVYVAGYEPGASRKGYQLAKQIFEEGRVAAPPTELPGPAAQRALLPEGAGSLPGATSGCYGYLEPLAGWAHASQAMDLLVAEAQRAGVKYESAVVSSIDDSGDDVQLKTEGGKIFEGDLLIVAAGAWTPSLLPEYDVPRGLTPTGQVLACIQLTSEEADRYSKMPVILDLSTEYYQFPPNEDNIMKIAIHGYGSTHTNPLTRRSEPVTAHFHPDASLAGSKAAQSVSEGNIPAVGAEALRACLARILPDLATRDFASTRLCWYTESTDSHFLIDFHPTRSKLVLSTAGSGHGFKFMPLLGDLLVQRLEGTLPLEQSDAFSATRERPTTARAEPGKRRQLETSPMATEKELRGTRTA